MGHLDYSRRKPPLVGTEFDIRRNWYTFVTGDTLVYHTPSLVWLLNAPTKYSLKQRNSMEIIAIFITLLYFSFFFVITAIIGFFIGYILMTHHAGCTWGEAIQDSPTECMCWIRDIQFRATQPFKKLKRKLKP